jgi:hypothetical protein
VALGFHTWPQVMAGAALGAATAAAWFAWGTRGAVAGLRAGGGLPALYAVALACMAAFAARNLLDIRRERRRAPKRGGDGGGDGGGWAPAPVAG